MIKKYLHLAKPGIIGGNLFSGIGGYFLAANGSFDIITFTAVVVGLVCIIGSACVFNNVIDIDIDSLMERTQTRPLITGAISKNSALLYGTILMGIGFSTLYFYTSIIPFALGVFAFFVYVVAYSLWTKRNSIYGTFVGSFSGAMPPVVGYSAVTQGFGIPETLLLAIFIIWQMPHSYAIALFRFSDYKKANIQVLPVAKGFKRTYYSMCIHIAVYVILVAIFGYLGYTNPIVTIIGVATGLHWLKTSIQYDGKNEVKWAKKVFLQSIMYISIYNILIGSNAIFNWAWGYIQ